MHAALTLLDIGAAALCGYCAYKAYKRPEVFPRWYLYACIGGTALNIFAAML